MKYGCARALLGVLIFAVASPISAAPKVIPVVAGHFSTGQWYFEGERSSLGGNVGLTFVPAVQFSNRFSVLPVITSQYRGTRSAEELAGGNTLFQDTWENGVSLKGVHGLGTKWKLREKVGYRSKWFRETTDESWTDGLYDYQVLNVGAEIERSMGKKSSVALGYDLSLLQFPNYVSLESTQSGDLAREFAGKDALDNIIHLVSIRARSPFYGGLKNTYQVIYSPRYYTDQTIVNISGLLTPEKREDTYVAGSLGLERGWRTSLKSHLIANINYGYTTVDSNQNHYDARLTHFVANFYDYDQHAIAGNLTLVLNLAPVIGVGAVNFDVGYSYSRRDYNSRIIQNSNGAFGSEKLYITERNLHLGFGFPLSKALKLKITSDLGRSKSNNNYEAVYRYNYDNANYQFGFTYEY